MPVLDLPTSACDRAAAYVLRKATERDDGSLVGEMVIATVGVMEYAYGKVMVPRETLEDPDAIASLRLRPLIGPDTHTDDQVVVSPEQMAERRIGHVGEDIRMEGDDLVASYVIDTAEGKRLLSAGLRGVSPGYTMRLVDSPEGLRQEDRRYLHVALVGDARGGSRPRIAVDGADQMDDAAITALCNALLAPLMARLTELEAKAAAGGSAAAVVDEPDDEEKEKAEEAEKAKAATDAASKAVASLPMASVVTLVRLADRHGVAVDGLTYDAARRAVAAKIAPALAADAPIPTVDGVLAGAAMVPATDAWDGARGTGGAVVTDQNFDLLNPQLRKGA